MSEHTPTPWYFFELDRRPDGCGYIRVETDNFEISHHGDMGRSREENLANAAFIVKACNSHDALVKALEDIRELECGPLNQASAIAREALAKVSSCPEK